MIEVILLAAILLMAAYLWTAHCRHVREDERRKALEVEIEATQKALEAALEHGNVAEHKRLRAEWLRLRAQR